MLADMSLVWLSSERLHSSADSDGCKDLLPNSGWYLEIVREELGEGARLLKWIGTPQEDHQSQLTWNIGSLRD